MNFIRLKQRKYFLTGLTLLLLFEKELLAENDWTGASSQNVTDPNNWSLSMVPGPSDVGTFTNSLTYTPLLDSPTPFSVGGLLFETGAPNFNITSATGSSTLQIGSSGINLSIDCSINATASNPHPLTIEIMAGGYACDSTSNHIMTYSLSAMTVQAQFLTFNSTPGQSATSMNPNGGLVQISGTQATTFTVTGTDATINALTLDINGSVVLGRRLTFYAPPSQSPIPSSGITPVIQDQDGINVGSIYTLGPVNVTLENRHNTYSGGTRIGSGSTIGFSADGCLGAVNTLLMEDSSTLQAVGGGELGGSILSRNVQLLGNAFFDSNSAILTATGVISGTGFGITQTSVNPSPVQFRGLNTYTGNASAYGIINILTDQNLGLGNTLILDNPMGMYYGGTLQAGSLVDLPGGRTIQINTEGMTLDPNGNSLTIRGVITDLGVVGGYNVRIADSSTSANGTVVLRGTNAFGSSGGGTGLIVGPGTVNVTDDSNLGASGAPLTLGQSMSRGILQAGANISTLMRQINLGNSLAVFDTNNHTITVPGTITDGGSNYGFIVTGGGTLVLPVTGATSLGMTSPGITVLGGTLNIYGDNNLGTPNPVPLTMLAGSTLQGSGPFTVSGSRTLTFNAPTVSGQVTIDTNGHNCEIDSNIQQTSIRNCGLTLIGGNSLTLQGVNSYGGPTQINDGTLIIDIDGSLTGGNVSIASGSTLDISGSSPGTPTIGDLTGNGAIHLGMNSLTANISTPNVVFGGVMSGTGGSFTKTGSGTLTLSADQTFTGECTIAADGGTLIVDGSLASGVTVGDDATLAGTGSIQGNVQLDPGGMGTGRIQPGNPETLGAQQYLGDLDMSKNGYLLIEVNPTQISAAIVTGTATLNGGGGSSVTITPVASPDYVVTTYSPFLSAGTLTGSFPSDHQDLGFYPNLNPQLVISGQSIALQLTAGGTFTWKNSMTDANSPTSWNPPMMPPVVYTGVPLSGDIGYFPDNEAMQPSLMSESMSIGTLHFDKTGYQFSLSAGSTLNLSSGPGTGVINKDSSVSTEFLVDNSTLNFYKNGGYSGSGGTTIYTLTTGSSLNFHSTVALYPNGQDPMGGSVQIGLTASTFTMASGSPATTIDVLKADNASQVHLGGALTIAGTGFQQIDGQIVNATPSSGSLIYSGPGTLTLTNATNTYSGGTRITGTGTLAIQNAALPSGGDLFVGGSATFNMSDMSVTSQTIGDLTGAGNISLGANTLIAGTSTPNVTFSGVMSDTGSFTKHGTGTLNLTTAQTFTGACNVNAGTLVVAGLDASVGGVNVAADSTLSATGTINGAVMIGSGFSDATLQTTGSLILNNTLDISTNSSTLEIGIDPSTTTSVVVNMGTTALTNANLVVVPQAGLYSPSYSPTLLTSTLMMGDTFSSIDLGGYPGFTPSLSYNYMGGTVQLVLTAGKTFIWKNSSANSASAGSWTPTGGPPNSGDVGYFASEATVSPSLAAGASQWIGTLEFASPGTTFYVFGSSTLDLSSGPTTGVVNDFTSGDGVTTFNISNSSTVNFYANGGSAGSGGTTVYYLSSSALNFNATNQLYPNSQTTNGIHGPGLVQIILTGSQFNTAGASGVVTTIDSLSADSSSTVTLGGQLVLGNSLDQTISGSIVNVSSTYPGSLYYQGSGTLTLGGTNTYSGGTTINATGATLALSNSTAILAGSAVTVTKGTFDISSAVPGVQIGDLTGAGSVVLGSNTLTVGTADSVSFDGFISGLGGLTKVGAGALTLSNNQTFTGVCEIAGGTLIVNGNMAANVIVNSGAKLQGTGILNGSATAMGTVQPDDPLLTFNAGLDLTNGTLAIGITPSQINVASAAGTGVTLNNSALVITPQMGTYSAGTYPFLVSTAGGLTGSFFSADLGSSSTYGFTPFLTYRTNSSGPGSVALTLFSGSVYTWTNTVSDVNAMGAWNPPSPIPGASDIAIFPVNPVAHPPDVTMADIFSINSFYFDADGTDFSVKGTLNIGNGGINHTDSAYQTTFTVDGGTINFGDGASACNWGTAIYNVSMGGEVAFNSTTTSNGQAPDAFVQIALSGGSFIMDHVDATIDSLSATGVGNTVEVGAVLTVGNSAAQTIDAAIADHGIHKGALTYQGTGTLTLTGANTYGGNTTISSTGTLATSGTGALPSNGNLQFNDAGIFDASQSSVGITLKNLNGGSSSAKVNLGGNALIVGSGSFSGSINDGGLSAGTHGASLTVAGPGTLTLMNATNSYTGGTLISDKATLNIAADGSLGAAYMGSYGGLTLNGKSTLQAASDLTLISGRTVTLNNDAQFDANSHKVVIDGTIAGPGSLTLVDSSMAKGGSLRLPTGTAFGGAISINADTLIIDGLPMASSVTVASGATLQGTGTVTGSVTSSGTIYPGAPTLPATLTLAGGLALSTGSELFIEFASTPAISVAAVTGDVDITHTTLHIDRFSMSGYTDSGSPYTFLTATGTITTPFSGTPHLGSYPGYNASLDYGTAHQVSLVLTPGRTFIWTGNTSTDADNSANWMVTGMPGVPLSGDVGFFSSVPTNQPALLLSSESMDIGTLQFDVSGITFTVSTSNSLTLGTGDGTGVLNTGLSIHSTFAIDGGTVSLSDLGGSAGNGGTTTYTLTSGGTLNFLATGSNPSNGQTNSGLVEITLDGGSTFTLADVTATIDSLSSTNDNMTPNSVQLGSTLTLGNSSSQTLGAQITGIGGLTYQGSNTLTLTNGSNNYSGDTEIDSGTISVTKNGALGMGTLQMNGGTLQAGANVTVNNDVTLSATGLFDTQAHTMTLSGTISGDQTLTKNGLGILALTADNSGTFGSASHGVTVNAGTLQISNDNNLGAANAPLTLQNSTLQATGNFTLSSTRPIDLSSGGTIDVNGKTIEIDSTISGTSLFVQDSAGGGSLTLTSTLSDYTDGMTIDGATVVISSDGSTGPLGIPSRLTFAESGTSTLQAGADFTFAATRKILISGTGVIDTQGHVVSQNIASTQPISGAGILQILGTGVSSFNGQFTLTNSGMSPAWSTIVGSSTSGTAAKLTLSGSKAVLGSGDLTIYAGSKVEFVSGAPDQSVGALSGAGSISLGSVTLTSTTSTSSQFDGQITGSGSFNFNGASPSNTLTITSNQAFTGMCTVQGGTLILGTSNSQTTAGPVTVNSGAILKGIGKINGLVTVKSGGTLQPGTSVGTQTFASGLDLQSGSTLFIEINDAGEASLADVLSGDVTLSGVTLTILKDSGNYTARVYPPILRTDAGIIHDTFLATNLGTYPGLIPGIQYNTNSVVFSLTAIPGIPLTDVTPGNNQATAQYLNSLPPYILGDELGRLAALNPYELNKALASIAPTRNAIPTFVSQNISFELSSIVNERSSRLHQLRLLEDTREGAGKTALSLLDQEVAFVAHNDEPALLDSRSDSVQPPNTPSLLNNGWLSGFGMLARQASQNEVPKFNFTSGGVVGGYDHTFNDTAMAGIGVAYVYTNYSTNEAGQGHLNTGLLSLYSTIYVSHWYLELSLWGGVEHVKNTRDISYPGYSQKAASSYNAYQGDAHFGCGYDYNFNIGSMASILEPFVAIDWACSFVSNFTEHGEGVYDMSVKKRFSSMLRSEVGINNYFSWVVGDGNFILRDKFSYVNKAPFKTGRVNAQIVGAPTGYFVDSFTTNQNLFSPALEFAYKQKDGTYASFTYEGEFGSGYIANEMNIKIGTYF